ncbi:MAG: branched-chain amino acid ABC transporter permease [Ilumatobacteraceae bacterium]
MNAKWGIRAMVFIGGIMLVLCFAGTQVSAAENDLFVIAQVNHQTVASGISTREPVQGVKVAVLDEAGVLVGEAVTDDMGEAKISVPSRAGYTVQLDTSTLPDQLSLITGTSNSFVILADDFKTQIKRVSFFIGDVGVSTTTLVEKISQRAADGIRLGLIIALCSVGLSLVFGTTGLTNFAHGEMITFGGLMAFFLNVTLGIPLLVAAPFVVAFGGLFGLGFNWVIFARLRKRGVGLVSQMVVSVGLSIMLRNMFLFQFKGRTRPLDDFSLQKGMDIGPIKITPRDLTTGIISLVVLITVALVLQRSRTGKAVRAVSDNPNLASATGINTQRIIQIVWCAGGALAALGGIFRGLDEQVGFQMGSGLLFLMFAGITLGGLGSAFGALVGGFMVGVLVEMASLVVPSELKNAPALLILILVLILRPQGILGKKQRVG